jgi:DUF971 family protein
MTLQPVEIERLSDGALRVKWNDGHEGVYPARYLRANCRCAACVEEWTGRQLVNADQIAADIRPVRISPVGAYAIHINWSDGHDTGIYAFDLLRSICPCAGCRGRSQTPAQP